MQIAAVSCLFKWGMGNFQFLPGTYYQSLLTYSYLACFEIVHMQSQEVLSGSVLLAEPSHKHWLTSANGRPPRRPGRCNLQR